MNQTDGFLTSARPVDACGPGQYHRDGMSLIELLRKFPNNRAAEKWFSDNRWPEGPICTNCESTNVHSGRAKAGRLRRYRCRECRTDFTVKTGSLMHDSKLGCQVWAVALYQATTNIKGVSSMKLHRDLGITQKSAWHVLHRIREAWAGNDPLFSGPVEADETYIGGRERNKPAHKRMKAAGGPAGKAIVAGVKDRATGQIAARVVPNTSSISLVGMVSEHTQPGAEVFTDEAFGYRPLNRMGYEHYAVRHSVSEWVNDQAHTNGMESFWAMLKRGYHGVYHHMSKEHLHRYVSEFEGRHNQRPLDTVDQMGQTVRKMDGKHLPYETLIADGVHARRRAQMIV